MKNAVQSDSQPVRVGNGIAFLTVRGTIRKLGQFL